MAGTRVQSSEKDPKTFDQAPPRKSLGQRVKPHFKLGGVGLVVLGLLLAIATAVPINLAYESNVPPEVGQLCGIPGMLWLRTLRACVLPLIMASMILSMFKMRKEAGVGGQLGMYLISYYMFTTLVAVIVGMTFAFVLFGAYVEPIDEEAMEKLQVASGKKEDEVEVPSITVTDQVVGLFESMIPANVVGAMANDALLASVVSGIAIGCLVPVDDNSVVVRFVREIETIVTKILVFVVYLTPFGVFSLLFASLIVLDLGDIVKMLFTHLVVQCIATAFVGLVIYPIYYFAFTRKNPFPVFPKLLPPFLTGFGTGSSAATLPVAMDTARKMGIPETIVQFSLPLGATINMDGSGIYFSAAAIWIATCQSISLSVTQVISIGILSTLGAIGASPIPNAAIAFILLTTEQAGISTNGFLPLIMASDMLLNNVMTALNETSDMWCALIMAHLFRKELAENPDLEAQSEGENSASLVVTG